jgi:hypothetical protein
MQKAEIFRSCSPQSISLACVSQQTDKHFSDEVNLRDWTRWNVISVYGYTVLCWVVAAFSVSQFYTQSVGHLGRWISPSQGRYLHTEQHKHRINTDNHALSGIRIHDPSVRAGEDCSCPRPRSHCDRPMKCSAQPKFDGHYKIIGWKIFPAGTIIEIISRK